MDLVTIYCPRCDYRKTVEAQKVPKGIDKKICPNCQLAFLLVGTPGNEKKLKCSCVERNSLPVGVIINKFQAQISSTNFVPLAGIRYRSKQKYPDAGGAKIILAIIIPFVMVAIIGILAAIAIPQLASCRARAHNSAAISDLISCQTQADAYYLDHSAYPTEAGQMQCGAVSGVAR